MSHSKTESLRFYKYLCQRIGSKKVIRARKLAYICEDFQNTSKFIPYITSGSKGEGLDLKGSDLDLMRIDLKYIVYESDNDAIIHDWKTMLVMDTEDAQPCFTQLRLYSNVIVNSLPNHIKQNLQQHSGKHLLSSELYKSQKFKGLKGLASDMSIHGPCISDKYDNYDFANCIKCDQWVSQAQPWISRSRLIWPSPELISKITSCGTLFVPVAEKILIYSVSHTQLLCYALIKILLKEIVNREEDIQGLLCSYFLKTLMFWMSEEIETSVWRPDNIIPCFMACSKRLLYCIEYSTLLHYFIPDNNLFYLRFNSKQGSTLINFLKQSYQNEIEIFSLSQTLHDFRRFPCETTRSMCEITVLMKIIIEKVQSPFPNTLRILNTLLHHCKTDLSKVIFKLSTSRAYQIIPFALLHVNNPNNKQQYKLYKHHLSQLLVGVHADAVSGWLKLACFFYGHKNHLTSTDIIDYTLSKYTDESCLSKITLKQTKTLKLMSLVKKIPSPYFLFHKFRLNSVIPIELKCPHVFNSLASISSQPFAHFLRFLCCYHLHDFESCQYCINKLLETVRNYIQSRELYIDVHAYNLILLGIALQMLGDRDLARKYFRIAAFMMIITLFNMCCNQTASTLLRPELTQNRVLVNTRHIIECSPFFHNFSYHYI